MAKRVRNRSLAELAPFAILALIAALIAGFGRIAGEIVSGDTYAFDRELLLALRNPADLADPIGPAWLENVMRDITSLGSFTFVAITTLAVIGYLAMDGKRAAALFVLVATAGGIALSEMLKMLFARPRPDLVAHLVDVQSMSFPSGHAMQSAVTFLTLGALLTREIGSRASENLCDLDRHPADACWSAAAGSISACIGRPTCWPAGAQAQAGRWPAGWWPAGCRIAAKSSRRTAPAVNRLSNRRSYHGCGIPRLAMPAR